jgi:pyruvate/2-oxoglutarate dehydrogenase complex dihydrolipoamide acyltransferase (E2) component
VLLQSAILGMHNITQRAMVVNGTIQPRPMMYIALTYDHRLIDGREVRGVKTHVQSAQFSPSHCCALHS